MDFAHSSVMVDEVLEHLAPDRPNQLLVDATVGEGGHSALFLNRFPKMRLVGVDADSGILARARERLRGYGNRVVLYNEWFDEFFEHYPVRRAPDRILLDLGVSMYHYRLSKRGFSLVEDEPLDMRLATESDQSAEELIHSLGEQELADVIFRYGEERYSRRIAGAIVRARREGRIHTSRELAEVVKASVPGSYRHGRIHPATRTFQALRIAVNDELGRIERGLSAAVRRMANGGRIGVIAFHSLEDRIVKWFFRERATGSTRDTEAPMMKHGEADLEIVTKKPLRPSQAEVARNPAARSARFRVAVKRGT
jgi:16S rRNA (cytosine1402-N4)-methyltransferase